MIKIRNWRCVFLYLLLITAAGCNSNADARHQGGSASKTGQATTYKFALQLKAGTKYYYTLTNETITKLEVDNTKITTSNNATIGLIYEVLQAGADTTLVKLTYDKLLIEIKKADDKQVIDADNTGEDASTIDRVMSSIKGSSLLVTLLKNGTILKVDGTEAINTKVLSSLQYLDDNSKMQVTAQLSKIVGADFIKGNVGQAMDFYPDSAVAPGASWVRKSTQPGEIKFDAVTTYTLTDLEDGVATIKTKSVVDASNAAMEFSGQKIDAAIKGSTTGSFEANMSTGMLTKSSSTTTVSGTIQIMMKVVPVDITINKEFTAKQL